MNEIIITDNLSRHYGKVKAVDRVSLSIRKGEIYGFLGLNGAGKTTTIRVLLGLATPTSGSVFIKGTRVSPNQTGLWKDIGYLVETPYSYPDLTTWENLYLIRSMRFISDTNAVDRVIEKVKLVPFAQRKAKHLSSGNAQRLGLAKALIHNPDIMILDEPTNGLDPAGIVEIRELLLDLSLNHGVTIFISSHILGEISRVATRIGIIHHGQLIQEINTDELERYRWRRLLIDTLHNKKAGALLEEEGYGVSIVNEEYRDGNRGRNRRVTRKTTQETNREAHQERTQEQSRPGTSQRGEQGILAIKSEKAIQHPEYIATMLVNAGYPPRFLKVEEEDLESYFLRIIGMKGGV